MNNPVTIRRIEIAYGSIEAFFENPRAPVNSDGLKNLEWMRTVTKEEAQESRMRLERWAASTTAPGGGVIGEWIFGVRNSAERPEEAVRDVASLTPNAVQRNWRTPAKFAQCPTRVHWTGSPSMRLDLQRERCSLIMLTANL